MIDRLAERTDVPVATAGATNLLWVSSLPQTLQVILTVLSIIFILMKMYTWVKANNKKE